MAAVLGLIDEPKLRRLAGKEWFDQGTVLASSGVVDLIEISPLKIKAQVKDDRSQSYVEVKLIAAMGRLIYSCTCDQSGFCPHCVAAAITTAHQAAVRRSEEQLSNGEAGIG